MAFIDFYVLFIELIMFYPLCFQDSTPVTSRSLPETHGAERCRHVISPEVCVCRLREVRQGLVASVIIFSMIDEHLVTVQHRRVDFVFI